MPQSRPLVCKTDLDHFDTVDFSPRPDRGHGHSDFGKDGKAPTSGTQEDQTVVALSGKRSLGPDPGESLPHSRQATWILRFSELAITPFVVLHASASALKSFSFKQQ